MLNPATGSITTQWNVTFDDWFTTVGWKLEDLPNFNAEEEWSNLFGTTTSHFPEEPISEEPTENPIPVPMIPRSEQIADAIQPVPLNSPIDAAETHAVKPIDPVTTHPIELPAQNPTNLPLDKTD